MIHLIYCKHLPKAKLNCPGNDSISVGLQQESSVTNSMQWFTEETSNLNKLIFLHVSKVWHAPSEARSRNKVGSDNLFLQFYLHMCQCNINNVKRNLEHRFCLREFSPISSAEQS